MAFIYEINGQRVQFDHEPSDSDIDEAARGLGAKPESRMPKPVEGSGGAAFGVYRPAGRRPESQQDREASKEMAVQTARGIASNIPALAGIPGSVVNATANLPRTAQDLENRYQRAREAFTGQAPQEQPLPEYNQVTPYDMSYFANLTPGPQPSSPAGQLAFGAGQMVGAPVVPAAAKMGMEAGKGVAGFGKGFARGLAYPNASSPETALAPIRPTYVPHEQVSEFMAGQRPASTLTEVPTKPLYENKPVANWAYGMAPETQEGQKLVPYAGRTLEGVGEQIGSQYRTNPLTGLVDIGATLATGVPAPLTALARSVPAIAAHQLQKATQFEPGFGPAREAALMREGQLGLQANMPPQVPQLPAPGPVAPMIASQSGEITAPGGRPLPTQASGQPVTQPISPVAPATPKGTPAQISQQMAAQKLAEQQQSWQQRAGVKLPAEGQIPTPTKKVQPVQPTPVQPTTGPTARTPQQIRDEINVISNQAEQLQQQGLSQGIKYGTPEGEAYQAQLGQLAARGKVLEKELSDLKKPKTLKKDVQVKLDKTATFAPLEGKVEWTHSTPDRSKLFGTMNDGTPVEIHTTTDPVKLYDISNKKNPTLIAEYGRGGKEVPSKKGPSNVSQMLTEDSTKIFPSKEAFEKERIFSDLKDIPHEGKYQQGDKIIHVEAIKYGNLPKDITSTWEQTKTYATDKSGKRVPIGKEWTEADPEPLTSQLKRKLKRD